MVAVLDHDLQETGTYCTSCLRSVDPENVVIPPVDRFNSVYCSIDCETRSKQQSQNLLFGRESVLPPALLPLAGIPGAAENRNAAQTAFTDFLKSNGKSLPLLVARFAARQGEPCLIRLAVVSRLTSSTVDAEISKMIPPEMRTSDASADDENSDYDNMERLRYVDTEVTQEEKTLLSNVLASALPGLERLLGDDRHDVLKGKMRYNSIGVTFSGGRDDKARDGICNHVLISFFQPHSSACVIRPPRGHREDTHTIGHLETNRYWFLLCFQLRKSNKLHQTTHPLSHANSRPQLGHSCDPTVRPSFDETGTSELSLIALRDLKKGDELTMAYVDVTQCPGESVIDARRRRRQELARGWKFACECSKCAADALVQTEGPDGESTGNNDTDLGVPLEAAKLEEAVARVEAQLAQATVSEPPVALAPEPAPANADTEDEHVPERTQELTA